MQLFALAFVLAHGGSPVATTIKFPPQYPDSIWATTTSQGIYAKVKNGFRWLCEDAFGPYAGVRDFAVVGEGPGRWVVSTSLGLFVTDNEGCDSDIVRGPLAGHRPGAITAHPERPDEVVVSTRSIGRENDVFFSDDGGASWVAVGLGATGVTRTLLRSDAAPDRLYVSHQGGLARSDDGGRSFAPLPPPGVADPDTLRFLATDPVDPNGVFCYAERFPVSTIFRSEDAGETWTEVLEVEDVTLGLALSADGAEALLTAPIEGWWRSADGGRTWAETEAVVPRIGCLTRAPDGALHACANPIFMGPWVLGRSVDLGRTWQATLPAFEAIESAWDCSPNSRAWRCCRGLCPGNQTGPECADPTVIAEDPACAAPDDGWDGGLPPDAGIVIDAGPRPDAGRGDADADLDDPDAEAPTSRRDGAPPDAPAEPAEDSGGGCTVDGHRGSPAGALIALLAVTRRRRFPQ